MLKRFCLKLALVTFLLMNLSLVSFADDLSSGNDSDATVLPATELSVLNCKQVMNFVSGNTDVVRKKFKERGNDKFSLGPGIEGDLEDILGCGIKTGQIRLWMIPYYIRYILEFVIQLGGLVAVGGIIYGGYLYLFAGVSEDKDKGKKAIMYSVVGIVVSLLAWAIVNIIIAIATA